MARSGDVDHYAVVESAVVGKRHDIKGESIAAFVTVKEGITTSDELMRELREHVGQVARLRIAVIGKLDLQVHGRREGKVRAGAGCEGGRTIGNGCVGHNGCRTGRKGER